MSEEGNPAGLSSCSGGLRPLVELCGRAVWDHAALFKGLWFGEKGECFWVNTKWKHLGSDVPKEAVGGAVT